MKSIKVRITESIVDVVMCVAGVATLAALVYLLSIILAAVDPAQ